MVGCYLFRLLLIFDVSQQCHYGKQLHKNTNTIPTFFGFEINHSQDGVCDGSLISFYDYYDIINPKTGEIICMDGETIRILDHEIDCYTLISEESNTSFKLSQDEVNQCIFEIE